MNVPHDESDDLQEIWRKDSPESKAEENSMMLRLVQDKGRSLQDWLRGEDMTSYIIALSFAPLTALAVWKSRPVLLMQIGYSMMTAILVAGAIVTWINQRRATALLRNLDISVREYQTHVVEVLEQRIRFSRGIKYWYAIPLFLGFSLAIYPIVRHYLPQPWSILLVAVMFMALEYSTWRMHDLKRVPDLQRRKEDLEHLLREMEQDK